MFLKKYLPFSAPECGSNPGWRKNNGVCYYYNDTDIVDFHMAIVRCYEEKSQLVSIADEAEQSYVLSLVCDVCPDTAAVTFSTVCPCPNTLSGVLRWAPVRWPQCGLE